MQGIGQWGLNDLFPLSAEPENDYFHQKTQNLNEWCNYYHKCNLFLIKNNNILEQKQSQKIHPITAHWQYLHFFLWGDNSFSIFAHFIKNNLVI
jgi:hypothetical protein